MTVIWAHAVVCKTGHVNIVREYTLSFPSVRIQFSPEELWLYKRWILLSIVFFVLLYLLVVAAVGGAVA